MNQKDMDLNLKMMETDLMNLKEISTNNLYSIKDKLNVLEERSGKLTEEADSTLADLRELLGLTKTTDMDLSSLPQEMQNNYQKQLKDRNEQIVKHFTRQGTENKKMEGDLKTLGDEHLQMMQDIQALQKKLCEIEMKIGVELPNTRTI